MAQELNASLDLVRPQGQAALKPVNLSPRLSKSPRVSLKSARQTLLKASKRPELHHLCQHFEISVDPHLACAFQLRTGHRIAVAPAIAAVEAAASVALRHCAEIDLLRRLHDLTTADRARLDVALIAVRVAALYQRTLTCAERKACEATLPPFLSELYRHAGQSVPFALGIERDELCRALPQLLPLGAGGPIDFSVKPGDIDMALASLRALGPIAAPTDFLLISDGDGRLDLNGLTGLNQYGASPRPRLGAIEFSSTTASSISRAAFDEAELLRQSLLRDARNGFAGNVERTEIARIKGQILGLAGTSIADGSEIVLAASGTDALLCASQLSVSHAQAKGAEGNKLTILVPAVEESGSGVVYGALLRHFNTRTALGEPVDVDAGIDGSAYPNLSLATVAIRNEAGHLLDAAAIDQAVVQEVEAAISAGQRVLLHLIDVSKTGLILPSLAVVDGLCARFGDRLDVVVDACQLRLSPATVRAYLARGWLVALTGSKFLRGPAFSGALIIPPSWVAALRQAPALPIGFIACSVRQDWPEDWGQLCRQLTMRSQPGLLLRWHAALSESTAFAALDEATKTARVAEFGRGVEALLASAPLCQKIVIPAINRDVLKVAPSWDRGQSIFTFALRHADTGLALTTEETRLMHRWLNRNLGELFEGADAALATTICHIGQPVAVGRSEGRAIGALRIAASTQTLATDGIEAHLAQVGTVFQKIALLLGHFARLRDEADRVVR